MSEWWTYTLADFLLFSPATYYRLFEIYNAAIWPAQVATILLGAGIPLLLRRAGAIRGRAIATILAGCWLFVAIAFQAHRYASINWAAVYFAWVFGLEAALLVWVGVVRGTLVFEWPADAAGRAGLGLFLFALLVQPLFAPLCGRAWRQAEIFGVAPDPTVVATLGLLVLARGRGRWALMILPLVWCVITGAFLLAMKAPDSWIAPLAAVLAIALAVRQASPRREGSRTAASVLR